MAKKGGRQDQPYGFAERFEREVAFLACTDPRFLARSAHEVRPDLLTLRETKLALAAAQAIQRDRGKGPASAGVVIQFVARQRDAGKLTHADVQGVAGLFDAFDEAKPRVEDVEAELVAVLKGRLRHAAAQAAIDEHNTDEWEKLPELLKREESLGRQERGGENVVVGPKTALDAVKRIRGLKREPLGIDALDEVLNGGVPRGTLTCFMAGPGGAKSMTMSHCVGQMSVRGLFCAYATLEVPPEYVTARILANQIGITIDEILDGAVDEEVEARIKFYGACPVAVRAFTPHTTTVPLLEEWVGELEDAENRALDVLVVDYADKMTASGKPDEKGMYQEMRIVYESLRVYLEKRRLIGLTASQSKAREDKGKGAKGKTGDIEHVADSMHKVRIVDHFIPLAFDDDTREMTFFTAKNRFGEGRRRSVSVPVNFGCGQVAPVARAVPPDGYRARLDPNEVAQAEAAASRLGAAAPPQGDIFR